MGWLIRKRFPVLVLFIFLTLSSCHVARYVYWNFADINDYKKFPADTLHNSVPVFHFKQGYFSEIALPKNFSPGAALESFESYISSKRTTAFLIIRNDSLVYEKYFKGYDRRSLFPGFSITKSFVSALTGIAIQEGYIKSIHQPVTDFLTEMEDKGFNKVTIEDLLSMRSGIKFKEGYSDPFGGMAKFYYGKDLKKFTAKLKVEIEPGTIYRYQSANLQILTMILEKATGKRISAYLEEKIWQPVGMEFDGSWNMDSKKNRENKGFCCINARAIDFAKFGQLYLNKGKWNDTEVVPEKWVAESLKIQYDSKDAQGFPYTWLWRSLENGDFFAKGILGEFIYVCPSKKIVIVRIGEKSGDIIWPDLFQGIIKQL